ncbi:hypothetical protein DND132_1364 [Pseudodesulfovibrio mercurii]|uniref:Uncharacterized protein n=1 Tax=Pseudodesulfovibrio mercurii TaxID=641491 RepID=F0JDP1_9BACT|nr:hypothetical protein [Pseudodesulfovibrio mercurii]EGB14573.1 hypothetical protein DND132_1364 [Pseudodesulfovibrio mercurii]
MNRHPHTTDETGFDFMANQGVEEQDRDTLGIVFALAVMAVVTVSQYLGLL